MFVANNYVFLVNVVYQNQITGVLECTSLLHLKIIVSFLCFAFTYSSSVSLAGTLQVHVGVTSNRNIYNGIRAFCSTEGAPLH